MMVVLVALLVALALAPLWRGRRGGGFDFVLRCALTVAGGVAILVAPGLAKAAPAPPDDRPLEVPDRDYVGSGACRACHPGEHASWHGSFHRTMTQPLTRAALVPQFERLALPWRGQQVLLEWRDERLWADFTRGGRRPGPVHAEVVQVTGSHHLQVLWYATGSQRELAPVPLVFHLGEQRWLPLAGVFVLPPGVEEPPEPGAWNTVCVMCHTTAPRPRVDAGRTDTHVGEFGVACEACHGPGRAHVAANTNPVRRYLQRGAAGDATIAEPGKLPPARSAEVCGQCHAVSILREERFDDWRESGSPFVPGANLMTTHLVIGPEDRDAPELRRELQKNPDFFASSFWSDGQVRLSGREFNGLRASPCFRHGDRARQLDCTSCHRLHAPDGVVEAQWRAGQVGEGMRGNGACTQCHAQFAESASLAAHTHHAPGSSGSNCYDCHMSYTSIGLLKASRSHTITSPSVQAELATGRPNACNQCHLDRTLAWTAAALQERWQVPSPELDEEQRTVAASLRWLLRGDAGQRVLAAWSFGWPAAQQASGTDWMTPFLARLLDDPYHAVRFQAARALRTVPGGAAALRDYDSLLGIVDARAIGDRVREAWGKDWRGAARPAVLIDERGVRTAEFARLYALRNDRPMFLAE